MARPKKVGITPLEAESILQNDLANVVKRTKAGKPLTGPMRRFVRSLVTSGGRAVVPTVTELAEALSVSRRTIQRHQLKIGNPGKMADGQFDVEEWRRYLREQSESIDGDDELDSLTPQLRARLLQLKIEMAELDLLEAKGDLISSDSVRQEGMRIGEAVRKALTLHKLAASLVGLSVEQIESRLLDAESDVLANLHQLPQTPDPQPQELKPENDPEYAI